jgi:hypothetical protein
MDWNAIGAIGQMVGSVAVLVTLVYLAAQVRLAREEVRRAASRTRADSLREMVVATRLTNAPAIARNVKINRAPGVEPRPSWSSR